MLIIHITPDAIVAKEAAFHGTPGGTIIDLDIMPRTAATLLQIQAPITKRAHWHASTQTYAFTHLHDGDAQRPGCYRVITDPEYGGKPVLVLPLEGTAHWTACKRCRDGAWCQDGKALIAAALESGGAA